MLEARRSLAVKLEQLIERFYEQKSCYKLGRNKAVKGKIAKIVSQI